MTLFFYNVALLAALVLGSPWWLWRMVTTQKYREGLLERLGKVRLHLNSNKPVIWLHAVSVGEVLAVSRLVAELDRALPGHQIVVSTTTRTGQALARERFGSERVFYCPLDLPWAVSAYLNALKPSLFVLAETEFWPNLLSGCFRREIPVAVVNARISDRSWPRYRMLRRLWAPFLGKLSKVLAQSDLDAERLKAIGCRPERVSVAGNLKFDVRAATEADATIQLKARGTNLRFIVAGSTLEGEEAALLEAWPRLLEADPQLALILAPRHPERFEAVAVLLDKSRIQWVRRSKWQADPRPNPPEPLLPGQIVLLDTIGELASVYSLAAAAFVGGSLIPAGGHNPLEPAQFGVPIVVGPHYANFRAITDDLIAHDAIRIASNEGLAAALIELLRNRTAAEAMGARARQVFDQQAGATERCVKALRSLLPPQTRAAHQVKPPDPVIEAEARRLRYDGAGTEAILRYLRANGCGKIDSVMVLRSVYGFGLAQAKEIVDTSDVWKDRLAADNALWSELEEAARTPGSGISATESGYVIRVADDPEEK
ncbi:MAG: 3-deoxy-D-manno-octulosonic acid transferase [Terracidiphilus sp.]|jgi:3-deoxy-D-manno-octulosonic-acid transferase